MAGTSRHQASAFRGLAAVPPPVVRGLPPAAGLRLVTGRVKGLRTYVRP